MNWKNDNSGRNNATKTWKIGCEEQTRGPWKTLQTRQGFPQMHAFESLEFSGSSFQKQGKYKTSPHLKAYVICSTVKQHLGPQKSWLIQNLGHREASRLGCWTRRIPQEEEWNWGN